LHILLTYFIGAGTHLWHEGCTPDTMTGGGHSALCVNGTCIPLQDVTVIGSCSDAYFVSSSLGNGHQAVFA
jgi:hypothetical protein